MEPERKQEITPDAEICDHCGSNMDMHQTQYMEDGYDYIQWVCQNDENCGSREDRTLYHNDPKVQGELL